MLKRHKLYRVEFKALPDANGQKGRFEAVVAVIGNVDFHGDRVMPGAFDESIKAWQDSGDPIPVIWTHDWADPFAHIGSIDPNEVRVNGPDLTVAGQIDLDNPFAAQVYRLMKARRVREWSFGYDIQDDSEAEDGARNLNRVGIIEIGPALKGVNPDTVTLAVKAMSDESVSDPTAVLDAVMTELDRPPDGVKAGRVLSGSNEQKIREAGQLIAAVLSTLGTSDDSEEAEEESEEESAAAKAAAATSASTDEGKAKENGKAKDPSGGKADDHSQAYRRSLEVELLDLAP